MRFTLDYTTLTDPQLQIQLERIDFTIRNALNISPESTDVGLFDLKTGRVAAIHPDREEYAASVAKIGILLAYFELHPSAATGVFLACCLALSAVGTLAATDPALPIRPARAAQFARAFLEHLLRLIGQSAVG